MSLNFLLRDVFERLKCCLDPWLSCIFDCIHVCVFLFLENWFLAISIDPWHLLDTWLICRALKLFLIAISTPSRQLGGSIKKVPGSLIASRQLVDWSSFFNRVWWILPQHLSTATSVDALTFDTFLDTSRHLYLSSFTDLLYKGSVRFPSHFSRSLSRQICLFTSQNTLSDSKSLSKCFSRFFKFFSSFGKFLFSHLHAFHVLKPRFWDFSKLMSFCWNFGIGCCLNEFKNFMHCITCAL